MNLRERLSKVVEATIKEGVESSKDIISDNVVASFEDMGMANVAPGEFAQEEITDKENLVNKGDMSNDTEFNKEDSHPIEKVLDAAEDMMSDLVDISAPSADATLEIVKTCGEKHPEDCHCPECCHKHHHEHMGESTLKEEGSEPLFMYDPNLKALYSKWTGLLTNPNAKYLGEINPEIAEDLRQDGVDPENCTAGEFVLADMTDKGSYYTGNNADVWNSLVDKLIADAKQDNSEIRVPEELNLEDQKNTGYLAQPATDTAFDTPKALAFADSVESEKFGESLMAKAINKLLEGKTCEQYLKDTVQLKESDYAGPRDWNPDTRINASDVLNAIKQEVGDGSEGVHVDDDIDERKDKIYRVSQIDETKLPKVLKVETIELKYEDGAYRPKRETEEAPLPR